MASGMPALEMDFSWCCMVPHLLGRNSPRNHSNNIPQQVAGNQSTQNRAAVAADGDDFVEMLDLQAVVEGVANAMGGVEERNGAENEEIETDDGKRQEGLRTCVFCSFRQTEGRGDILNEEVHGDEEGGDDTAGAEEEPQERFDAKFGRLRVHLVFCPSSPVNEFRMIQESPQGLKPDFSRLQCRS